MNKIATIEFRDGSRRTIHCKGVKLNSRVLMFNAAPEGYCVIVNIDEVVTVDIASARGQA